MTFLKPHATRLLSLLRLMVGLLLLEHGTTKLLGFPASPMNGMSVTDIYGAAGVVELLCGALLVVGLGTRPAAFLASGMTAVAYFYAHFPKGIYPMLNGGETVVLFCFTCLYLAAAGGGPISLDRILGRG